MPSLNPKSRSSPRHAVSHADAAKALKGLMDLIGTSSPPSQVALSPEAIFQAIPTRSGRIPAPVQAELPVFDLEAYMNFGEDDDDDNDPDFRPARKAAIEEDVDEYVVDESDTASGDEELITAYSLAKVPSRTMPYTSTPADSFQTSTFDLDAYLKSLPSTTSLMPSTSAIPLNVQDFNLPLLTPTDVNPFHPLLEPPSLLTDLDMATPSTSLGGGNGIEIIDSPSRAIDDMNPPLKRGRGRPRKDPTAPPKAKPVPRKVIPPELRAQAKQERNRAHAKLSKERRKQTEVEMRARLEELETENKLLREENARLKLGAWISPSGVHSQLPGMDLGSVNLQAVLSGSWAATQSGGALGLTL